jgi:hypothetical protein
MKTTSLPATLCRWIARIVSTFAVVIIVAIAIGEGMPNPLTQPAYVQIGFVGLALIVGGFFTGWRWELAGGVLSLVGVCLIFGPSIVNGKITWFFAVLIAPGVLYITSHLLRSHAAGQAKTQPPAGSSA